MDEKKIPDDSATFVTDNEEAVVDVNVQDDENVDVPVSDPADLAENKNKETDALMKAIKEAEHDDLATDFNTFLDLSDK